VDRERWQKIKETFQGGKSLPPSHRRQFLDQACAGDESLRRAVETLLLNSDQAESFLEGTALEDLATEEPIDIRPSLVGAKLAHYQIESELGEGGQGHVYRAVDLSLGRRVAIKILPVEFTVDATLLRRFEREARTASSLNHLNIVTVYEVGRHNETHYIAHELVEGLTLRQRLRDGSFNWCEVVSIGVQIAAALKAAHSAGIIHRDIKPENLIIRPDGVVKLLDFGIARRFSLADAEETLGSKTSPIGATQAGEILGTIGYLSPEQARGEEVDSRADIFSLGVVLYEMLAGEHPFSGSSSKEQLKKISSDEELPPISDRRKNIPAALEAIVTKATRKSVAARYPSAGEMLDALDQLRAATGGGTAQEVHRLLAIENADSLLNQFLVLHDTHSETRIPARALWTIWRSSSIRRGPLERELMRKSAVSAMLRGLRLALLTAIPSLLIAAFFSITESWEGQTVHDGHAGMVRSAAFSPDGTWLVSVGQDKQAIVWDFVSHKRRTTLSDDNGGFVAAVFSPNGKWLATGTVGGRVIVWTAERLEKIQVLSPPSPTINNIVFSHDGRLLATSCGGGRIIVWSTDQWRKLHEFTGSPSYQALIFSPDDRWLIQSLWSAWDLANGQAVRQELGNCAEFSADGAQMATIGWTGDVCFWSFAQPGDFLQKTVTTCDKHAHRIVGRAVAFSPDGRFAASAADDILLWDATTHTKLGRLRHADNVWGLAFSPDSRWLVSWHGDGAILVWDVSDRRQIADFGGHSDRVTAAAFSSDSKRFVTASVGDRSMVVWDAKLLSKETVLMGHIARVRTIGISPNGDWIAARGEDGVVNVWNVAQPANRRTFITEEFKARLAISPDGRWVTIGTKVFDSSDGREIASFPVDPSTVIDAVAFSLDGKWLVRMAFEGRSTLWDTHSWRVIDHYESVVGHLTRAAFSREGEWLVTGDADGLVRLWTVRPFRPITVLGKHSAAVQAVAFSPDGSRIASASDDQTIACWDATWRHRFFPSLLADNKRVALHTAPVLAIGFSPDGKQLIAGDQDRSVWLYTRNRTLWGWRLN
jgi:WD40 repeat protein/serine/threonine protein kinase